MPFSSPSAGRIASGLDLFNWVQTHRPGRYSYPWAVSGFSGCN